MGLLSSFKIWVLFVLLLMLFIIFISEKYFSSHVKAHNQTLVDSFFVKSIDPGNVTVITPMTTPSATPTAAPSTIPMTTPIWHVPDYTLTWTTTQNVTLLSAYYETRPQMHAPSVVLLGYAPGPYPLYCLVTLSNGSAICLAKQTVTIQQCAYNPNGKYNPLYHVCLLDTVSSADTVSVPVSVRLSFNQDCSSATEDIKVYNFRPEKRRIFGVCVQSPMYGSVTGKSIIDFIEMNRVFGIDLFTIYSKSDFTKLANQYTDVVDYNHWPEFMKSDLIFYYGQILFINDCLYRNMHRVDYLVFIDIDEMIAPVGANATWNTVVEKYESQTNITSFAFDHVIYSQHKKENKPEYFDACGKTMPVPIYFTHFKRQPCDSYPRQSKIMVKPQEVFQLSPHNVCVGVNGHVIVPPTLASLHHYHPFLLGYCKNRGADAIDSGMLAHKDRFMDRINASCPRYISF